MKSKTTVKRSKRIGVVAPSSKVPRVELKLGVERIREEGFKVDIHSQCYLSHLFFAGTDEERAAAFFEYAKCPDHQVIWCARGGHGSTRLLPILQKLALDSGVPKKKLLVGYSDATALMEYVRSYWGWSTLHAPMPSMRKFSLLPKSDWLAMSGWIEGQNVEAPWAKTQLKFWTNPPTAPIHGPLMGGNLAVWNCLIGTRFQPAVKGHILFLEDVDENLYRIDRMLQHLLNTGSLKGIKAVVLGNFLNCRDLVPSVLKSAPSPKLKSRVLKAPEAKELRPLRKTMNELATLQKIFTEFGDRLGVPVAFGLPVGHGPAVSALPLGATYTLSAQGFLKLDNWDWLI
ncbi:MAG: LD-carboxypeptidase [Bdellovibrionia bacterium]